MILGCVPPRWSGRASSIQVIHLVLDNLTIRHGQDVEAWRAAHPRASWSTTCPFTRTG